MKMAHSWRAFDLAQEITDLLNEDGFLRDDTTDHDILLIRGLIQIKLEKSGR